MWFCGLMQVAEYIKQKNAFMKINVLISGLSDKLWDGNTFVFLLLTAVQVIELVEVSVAERMLKQ